MNKRTRMLKSIKQQLGAELRRVRQEKGLTIEEVAQIAGINSGKVINKFEEGKGGKLFFVFRLIEIYGRCLSIKLVE